METIKPHLLSNPGTSMVMVLFLLDWNMFIFKIVIFFSWFLLECLRLFSFFETSSTYGFVGCQLLIIMYVLLAWDGRMLKYFDALMPIVFVNLHFGCNPRLSRYIFISSSAYLTSKVSFLNFYIFDLKISSFFFLMDSKLSTHLRGLWEVVKCFKKCS